jgi:hypothetical protein
VSRTLSRRRAGAAATAAAGAAVLVLTGLGAPGAPSAAPAVPAVPAKSAFAPVQGFPGSDSLEAQTAAEQLAQARGLVPPGAYDAAFTSMQALPAAGAAWTESTDVSYDSDDLRYRDPYGNSQGGQGLVSGRVVALAAGPDKVLYAGAANGGVFRSAKGDGSDWVAITDGLPSLSVGDLSVAPDGAVWLATGEANTGGTSYAGNGVYRWSGGTWTHVGGSALSGMTINKLQFDGAGSVYAATSRGVWKTAATGAAQWTRVLVLNEAALSAPQASNGVYANIVNDVITRPGHPGEVLVAAGWRSSTDQAYYGNGFYLSTQNGAAGTFNKINPTGAINPKEIGNTTFAYDKTGTKLYSVIQSTVLINQGTGTRAANTVLAGVYVSKSGDIAGPWSKIADSHKLANSGSALKQTVIGKGYGPGVQAWYNQFLTVDPTNPNHVYLGLEEVYESYDAGVSWAAVGPYWNFYFPCWDVDPAKNTCPPTTHPDQHDAMFANGRVYVSNDGGVYSRPAQSHAVNANNNATDWADHNATLRSLQYYAASAGTDKTKGGVVLSGGLQDNGGSILRGLRPDGTNTDAGDGSDVPYRDGRNGTMGSNFGGDGGDVIVDPRDGCNIVQEYVYLSMRKTQNCGVSDGTVFSTVDIAPLDAAPRFIAPMEVDSANPDHWFSAGNSVWFNGQGFAIASGRDWVEAANLGTDANGRPNSTTALGSANDVAYAGYCSQCNNKGFTRGLARVQKVGGTWTKTTVSATGLPNRFLSGVWVDPANGNHVLVAVNGFNRRFTAGPEGLGHLFESVNGGSSFTDVGGNLPDIPADDVILTAGGTTAYVATDLGVVKGTRAGTTGAFTFTRLGTNLPAVTVMDLSVGPDGVLYAATHSRGIWGYKLP